MTRELGPELERRRVDVGAVYAGKGEIAEDDVVVFAEQELDAQVPVGGVPQADGVADDALDEPRDRALVFDEQHAPLPLELFALFGPHLGVTAAGRFDKEYRRSVDRDRDRDVEVVVVGAGLAGLVAALELERAGKRVLLLEARERVGGRLYTVRDPLTAVPVELGAEFLHGEEGDAHDLADELHLAYVEMTGARWVVRGRSGTLARDDAFGKRVDAALAAVAKVAARGADRAFTEAAAAARLRGEGKRLALAFVEGFQAAHPARISAQSLGGGSSSSSDEGDGGGASDPAFRLAAGYDALAAALAARLPRGVLRLGTVVERVTHARRGVTVHARAAGGGAVGPFEARRVVVTVPLGVLQAAEGARGAIEFEPPLTEKRAVIAKLSMGHVAKLTMRFREAVWTRDRRELLRASFMLDPGAAVPTWWTSSPTRAPVLVGWAGGGRAEALLAMGHDGLVDRALEALAGVTSVPRATLEDALEATWTHDWARDPFARGAYSHALVGGARAAAALATPAASGAVWFAGEATVASPYNGTTHGAIASGRRVARAILARR